MSFLKKCILKLNKSLIITSFILLYTSQLKTQTIPFLPSEIDTAIIEESDQILIQQYGKLYEESDHLMDQLSIFSEFLNQFYDETHWPAFNQQYVSLAEFASKEHTGPDQKSAKAHLGAAYVNEGYIEDVIGNSKSAREFYDKALQLYREVGELNEQGTCYNNIGYLFKNEGNLDSALYYFVKSKQIHKAAGDLSSYSLLLNNEGFIYDVKGDKVKALIKYDSARRIQEENHIVDFLTTTYGNLALIYGEFDDSLKEITYLLKGRAIADSLGDNIDMVSSNINIGSHFLGYKQPHRSLPFYKEAQDEAERLELIEYQGFIYNELARNFLQLEIIDSSEFYAMKAKSVGEKQELTAVLADAMVHLADISIYKKQFNSAVSFANKALEIANSSENEEAQLQALGSLIIAHEGLNNFQLAHSYKKQYDKIKDVEKDLKEQKTLYMLDFKRQVEIINKNDSLARELLQEKSRRELLTKELELEFVNKQRLLLIIGLLFSLLASWFIYRAYIRKKRDREIIAQQKEEVSKQRDIAHKNYELAEKNRIQLQQKNEEILDSILCARRLQEAVLPPQKLVKEWLTSSFILYKPKDIVSGDFYWMETAEYTVNDKKSNLIFFAVADCTGHGVPGAMVSVICAGAMNRAVNEFDLTDVGEILNKVSELIMESFIQSEDDIYDGMDIALCALDLGKKQLFYTGANNPLWIISKEKQLQTQIEYKTYTSEEIGNLTLFEIKGQRRAVGRHDTDEQFVSKLIQLVPGDSVYVFSDGYVDQFGGDNGKKFKSKRLKDLLLQNASLTMSEQRDLLDETIENWRGEMEQIDDISILGVKVNGKERANFTNRELEVLEYLREGLPSKLIADKMEISSHTVDTYRRRLLAKTNTYNSTELLQYAKDKEII